MGRLPASVTTQHSLADLVELQRGYDLTAAERMPGEIPVIGGGGPNGTHNAANVSGPGVVVVRSGSGFGNVWWVKEDFWAHNTVMFAKSFKGNHKRFAYYVLDWLDFTSYILAVLNHRLIETSSIQFQFFCRLRPSRSVSQASSRFGTVPSRRLRR